MTTISSISELLTLSGSQYRIFDVGRKIDKISKETFYKIEHNHVPYPYPIQSHACFAVVFWQKESSQPFIWFIKCPLDEKGLLNLVARDHYIAIIIEALGSNITDTPSDKQEELLKNNPYHFTPAQYKLAALNSMVNAELKREMSQYYALFEQYVSGDMGWDNWHNIGVQGINDFATQISQPNNAKILADSLPKLPEQVLKPLCIALESHTLPLVIINAVLKLLQNDDTSIDSKHHLLRSLSSTSTHPLVEQYIVSLLTLLNEISINDLILYSGRLWTVLENKQTLLSYFEAVAQKKDIALFVELFKDLVAMPNIRPIVFQVMRAPERSHALALAIGHVMQTTTTNSGINSQTNSQKKPQKKPQTNNNDSA